MRHHTTDPAERAWSIAENECRNIEPYYWFEAVHGEYVQALLELAAEDNEPTPTAAKPQGE